jgi:hypothetical protein
VDGIGGKVGGAVVALVEDAEHPVAQAGSFRSGLHYDNFLRAARSRTFYRLMFPVWFRVYPPPPSVYWNHQLSGKIRFDLWAAISYGQNIERQGVTGRNWVLAHDEG